jgi:outer membrane immunogenic protein
VKTNRVCSVVALLAFGAFAAVQAAADEMTVAPAITIGAPMGWLAWTGFYAGLNGGFGWTNSTTIYNANDALLNSNTCGGAQRGKCVPQADYTTDGALAGGQVGFNWQINSLWVTGVEADYQWSHITGQSTSSFHLGGVGSSSAMTNMNVNESVQSFGTLRARMGFVPMNPLFLYGTGGLAFGSVNTSFNAIAPATGHASAGGFSYACVSGTACFSGGATQTVIGWTAGAGAELALSNNLTLKSEFLFVDFAGQNVTVTATSAPSGKPSSFNASVSPAFLLARGGLNLRF